MNNRNLLPPITSTAQAREMGAKGGSASTLKKKMAAKIRELKKKGASKDSLNMIIDCLTDAEYSSFEILRALLSVRDEYLRGSDKAAKLAYLRELMHFHELVHGKKVPGLKVNIDNRVQDNHYSLADAYRKVHGTDWKNKNNTEDVP